MTEEQRAALLAAPPSWFNVPDNHPLFTALYGTGFVRGYRHQGGRQASISLTQAGLEARALIANTPTRD